MSRRVGTFLLCQLPTANCIARRPRVAEALAEAQALAKEGSLATTSHSAPP
jgi:hypothetical protein